MDMEVRVFSCVIWVSRRYRQLLFDCFVVGILLWRYRTRKIQFSFLFWMSHNHWEHILHFLSSIFLTRNLVGQVFNALTSDISNFSRKKWELRNKLHVLTSFTSIRSITRLKVLMNISDFSSHFGYHFHVIYLLFILVCEVRFELFTFRTFETFLGFSFKSIYGKVHFFA